MRLARKPRRPLFAPAPQSSVAVVLRRGGCIGLFKRSMLVGHDKGLWHCVSGYLPEGSNPADHALQELREETGVMTTDLDCFVEGPVIQVSDPHGRLWTVHTFAGDLSPACSLTLNWEHDDYEWAPPSAVPGPGQVAWLRDVVAAVSPWSHGVPRSRASSSDRDTAPSAAGANPALQPLRPAGGPSAANLRGRALGQARARTGGTSHG